MKFAVLGAGAYGTALGGILASNGYDVDYYDKEIEQERLVDVLRDAEIIVLSVPSMVAPHLLPYLPKDKPLVVATKGLLTERYFADFEDWMVLSGPGFADEMKAHRQTWLTATDRRILDWFRADYLKFDLTADRRGVLLCGALKNVYAIMAGLKGLERDTVEWNHYIEGVVKELEAILVANGALAETARLSSGIGDIKLTCGYPSRNFEFGDLLRQNPDYQPEKTVEGLSTIERIARGEIVVPVEAIMLQEIIQKWG